MERHGQRTGCRLFLQTASSGQLGARIEDAGNNEGANEVAFGLVRT